MYLKNARSMAIYNGEAHPAVTAQMPQELIVADGEKADVVLMFAMNQDELEKYFPQALERMGEKGSLWIGFLKQTAAKATNITRDSIAAYVKERGATPVAIMSVDSDWSALRLRRI
ncbi:MAG: DUF3052 family protein [Gammaproteobacteria bacterium]